VIGESTQRGRVGHHWTSTSRGQNRPRRVIRQGVRGDLNPRARQIGEALPVKVRAVWRGKSQAAGAFGTLNGLAGTGSCAPLLDPPRRSLEKIFVQKCSAAGFGLEVNIRGDRFLSEHKVYRLSRGTTSGLMLFSHYITGEAGTVYTSNREPTALCY
jgi:hypothetical protein